MLTGESATRGYSLSVELDLLIVTLNGIFIALFIVVRIPCIAVRYDTWAPFAAPAGYGSPQDSQRVIFTLAYHVAMAIAQHSILYGVPKTATDIGDQVKEEAG